MSYVKDNLGDGEVVEYMAKLHWIILVQPSIVLLFGAMLTREPVPIQAAGFVIGSLGFWWLMYSFAKYFQSEFVITNSIQE